FSLWFEKRLMKSITRKRRKGGTVPAERVEGEVLPGTVVALLCLRHFFTLQRRSDFLSPLMSISVEPSFFRYFFSTYFALIQASFSSDNIMFTIQICKHEFNKCSKHVSLHQTSIYSKLI
uniref:Uncharacterized protein n=1 Tax=Labrus bergylta TaxID=56723 RepID=A0A3Q3EBW2_9LABR